MSVVRDSAMTFATRVVIFVLQGVAALLLARTLGPSGRGLYALIVTVPHVAAMIANFGATAATAYSVSSGRLKPGNALAIALAFPLSTGLLAIALLEWAAPIYLNLYAEVPAGLFRLAIVLIPLIAIFNNLLGFLQGSKRFLSFNLLNFSNPAAFLLIFSLWLFVRGASIGGAVLSWQGGFGVAVVFGLVLALSGTRPDFRLKRTHPRTFLSYSSRISLNEIFTFLNYRLDIFLVGYFLDARAVGLYTVAVVVAETLWFLASSAANVLFPSFAERPLAAALELASKAFAAVLWLSAGLVLLLALVDRPLVRIAFGSAFLPSVGALNYLYPGVLLLSLYKVLASYIAARGYPGTIVRFAGMGVLLNFAANLLLIPRMGIGGAALASSFSYGMMFLAALAWFLHKNPVRVWALISPDRSFLGSIRKHFMTVEGKPVA